MSETIEAYDCYQNITIDQNDEIENSNSDSEECIHNQISNIDGSKICMECGVKIDEKLCDNETPYYGQYDTRHTKDPSRHNHTKIEERSLYNDLEPLGFPQQVIERANEYYTKIIENKIFRAKNRLSIVFICTCHAYEDIGEPRSSTELAKIFKLDKKGISNGIKTFSQFFRKRPEKTYINAMDIVPQILSKLNLDKKSQHICIDDMAQIYEYVKSKSHTFNSSNPNSIAAGLVYYYLKLMNANTTRTEYSKIVELTDITFTKIAAEIHRCLDNKNDIKL